MKKVFIWGPLVSLLFVALVLVFGYSHARPAFAADGKSAPEVVAAGTDNAVAAPAEAPAVAEAAPEAVVSQGGAPQSSVMELDMTKEGNVTLDFREADIRNVLKVLSYKSGLNIIAGPEVVGMVNIQLKDVAWEKALDVILSTYGYGYERKGTIILVTSLENLKKRREDAKIMADQEPLSTETYVLTFAKAADAKDSLEKMKSARGNINFDKRTNAIIITDVTSNLQLMRDVIKTLDTATPQVLIEAKIVETTLSNTEKLGIDWTAQGTITGPTRATSFPWDGTSKINRFIPAWTAAAPEATLSYGTLNLASFQALLQMLKGRTDTDIISNPKIVTMDNQPAKITVGKQYPVPNYTFNEQQAKLQVSGWNYMDIGVIFNVTPHVNNAGMVTLDIEPEIKDILEYATVENTRMPVLSNESVKTSVMIKDGQTLVIAGLIKNKKVTARTKVPILGDIPILGWLFQHKNTDGTVKSDLLIFLTPHIITPGGEPTQAK